MTRQHSSRGTFFSKNAYFAFAVVATLVMLLFWIWVISTWVSNVVERNVWQFSKYGKWGKSPQVLFDECMHSEDINEIAASVNAIALNRVHYKPDINQNDFVELAESVSIDVLIDIFEKAGANWGNRISTCKPEYAAFNPTLERLQSVKISDQVRATILIQLCNIYSNVNGKSQVEILRFFSSHVPEEESVLFPIWKQQREWLERVESELENGRNPSRS